MNGSQSIEDSHSMSYLSGAEPGLIAKIIFLFSHRLIFGPFFCQSSFKLHFSLPIVIPRHLRYVYDEYLFVTETLSTPTITELPLMECQDLLIPTRSNACVASIDLGLKSHPNNC